VVWRDERQGSPLGDVDRPGPIVLAASWSLLTRFPTEASLVGAFLIGAIGSAAYAFALFMGFLDVHVRPRFEVITEQGKTSLSGLRVIGFILIGAMLAAVLQVPDASHLAAVQALTIGIAWPSVIARMGSRAVVREEQAIAQLAQQIEGAPRRIEGLADRIAGTP
jgi:hypothetical protein